jgi:WD40 repeat protein/outer membrane lipoprotein-sorting protein
MNRLNQHWGNDPSNNILDNAIETIVSEPLEMQAVDRITSRALQLDQAPAPTTDLRPASTASLPQARHRSWIGLASLAASITILIASSFWFNSGSRVAFGQVVERIQKVVAVRFATHIQFGSAEPVHGTTLIQEDSMRMEQMDGQLVQIAHARKKTALALDVSRKKSQTIAFDDRLAQSMINPIAELLAAQSKSVQSLGQERLEGRKMDAFRIRDLNLMGMSGMSEMTLWVDVETQLPAKIVVRDPDPRHKLSVEFDHFEWNPTFDPSLLSLTPPVGFTEGKVMEVDLDKPVDSKPVDSKPDPSIDISGGILSNQRVPGCIEVDYQHGFVTAILRDAESTKVQQRRSNELRQWELKTGKIRWTQTVGGASSFALLESKGWLALVEGQEIQIRELDTGNVIARWESSHTLGDVALDRSGKWLAHGYSDWRTKTRNPNGGIDLWDIESKTLIRSMVHGSPVDMVEFSPDGTQIASASSSIKLWNTTTGELEWSIDGRMRAVFSKDGTQLATLSNEPGSDPATGNIDIYDLKQRKLIRTLNTSSGNGKSYLLSIAFSPNGERLAASDWNGAITAWELASGKSLPNVSSEKGGVHCVRFTNDAQLVSGSEDGILRIRELNP